MERTVVAGNSRGTEYTKNLGRIQQSSPEDAKLSVERIDNPLYRMSDLTVIPVFRLLRSRCAATVGSLAMTFTLRVVQGNRQFERGLKGRHMASPEGAKCHRRTKA